MLILLFSLFFALLFGPRSFAGSTEVPADVDVPELQETNGEGEEKEDSETQQQREDEEVQSTQGSEGQKVLSGLDCKIQI